MPELDEAKKTSEDREIPAADEVNQKDASAPDSEQTDETEKKVYEGLSIDIKISEKDMADFILRHNYSLPSGWIGVLISIAAIVLLIVRFDVMDMTTRLAMIVIGALFIVVNPILLVSKAKKQVRNNPMFATPITYILSDDVIAIEQNGEQLTIPWTDIRVVKGFKKAIVVYVTRVRALLWPMTQIEAQYDDILKLLNEKLGTARVRVGK